jgi:hypothetical protein
MRSMTYVTGFAEMYVTFRIFYENMVCKLSLFWPGIICKSSHLRS